MRSAHFSVNVSIQYTKAVSKITFVTGNDEKFLVAEAACAAKGIQLARTVLDIDEIQGENPEIIALDKADKAFRALQSPVVINDDTWEIPGLNGFPGPYMKSMNHWLTAEDFLRLTRHLADRRAIIIQIIVYQDENGTKLFRKEFENILLTGARGSYGNAIQKIVSVPSDKGLSIAEAYDKNGFVRDREVAVGWDAFATWCVAGKK